MWAVYHSLVPDLVSMPAAQALDKLERMSTQSSQPMLEVKGFFPFDFMPDSLIIDPNKVDIIIRHFPFGRYVFSNALKNINHVTLTHGLLFAEITLEVSGYEANPPSIKWLTISDAAEARRVINGLLIAYKEGVDVSALPPEQVKDQTAKIGTSREFQG